MDIFNSIGEGQLASGMVIKTVDMHTSGEATRIVFPLPNISFVGRTLLEKRADAKNRLDWLRQRLMREPRGHAEMYGAFLILETELTESGEADVGVLFCHNEGYSTMCGHATIALGRFLVDTQDRSVITGKNQLPYLFETQETLVRLHAPCGVVTVSVPTVRSHGSVKSDPQRRVSFLSVPSFVGAINVTVKIPQDKRWKALRVSGRDDVTLDVAFGGAFYGIVSAAELGFENGIRGHCLAAFKGASKTLNEILSTRKELFSHPDEEDLEYLYGVIITENLGERRELGLCFFADQQVDRSPTGSGVCARVALAVEKGGLEIGEDVTFESVVSLRGEGAGFVGKAMGLLKIAGKDGMIRNAAKVRVEGQAYYTGAHSFVAEEGDMLADGFVIE